MTAINYDDVAVANIIEQQDDELAAHGAEIEMEIALETDHTVAPDQNSPKHIMNVLNDDCIEAILRRVKNINDFLSAAQTCVRFYKIAKQRFQPKFETLKILRRMKNIEDFLNAAETCVRFREIAKQRFPTNFKTLIINNDSRPGNRLSYQRALCFLDIFGGMLEKIEWSGYDNTEQDEEVFNAIAGRCVKTLKSLLIGSHNVDFSTKAQFQKLEELKVGGDIRLANLNSFPQLKRLELNYFENTQVDWLAGNFPNLEDVWFSSIDTLTDDIITAFLDKNHQIQRFCFIYCGTTNSKLILQHLGKCTSLTDLWLYIDHTITEKDVMHLSELRQLKSLAINVVPERGLGMLFDSFAENNVPLEKLDLMGSSKHSLLHLWKLKFLKSLTLMELDAGILPNLVTKMPMLESIFVYEASKVTLDDVRLVLKLGRNLKHIRLCEMHVDIDLDQYYSILTLTGDRVRVNMNMRGKLTVPEEILMANRDRIKLRKFLY